MGDELFKWNILQQLCRDKCGGEAKLLTKGSDNFEDQLMGQTQKPIFFPHGTKGQLWFNGTTATIQDALLGHLSSQAQPITIRGADRAVKGQGLLAASALSLSQRMAAMQLPVSYNQSCEYSS